VLTCTWAPTVFAGHQIVRGESGAANEMPEGATLRDGMSGYVANLEQLGISHLLIAQRWWGSGEEMEASSLDCLAATSFIAAHTQRINLVTAIHPGFFQPTAIAKWGTTLDRLTGGRWSINVTSGWNLREFDMYGIDALEHDDRYQRAGEFIEVLRGAWDSSQADEPFDFQGRFYHTEGLCLEPRPTGPLTVYQGGQSDAAIGMAASHSDWMFLNGGPPDKIAGIIERVRSACAGTGRTVRFALYAQPLCRATDTEAWAEIDARLAAVDSELVERRRQSTGGAEGMWAATDDPLVVLDTNEGFAARLIGSPETINERIETFRALGVEMLHLDLRDTLFREAVLPGLTNA
jgi:FMNH2-dependent dimethyl sulfone monooxygenase